MVDHTSPADDPPRIGVAGQRRIRPSRGLDVVIVGVVVVKAIVSTIGIFPQTGIDQSFFFPQNNEFIFRNYLKTSGIHKSPSRERTGSSNWYDPP